jgi:RND family efflux transporter MFP subunit
VRKQTVAILAILALTACKEEAPPQAQIRPVRTVVVKHTTAGQTVSLTGQVQAQDQVNLAFRINGRLIERTVSVGDRVAPGQVVARLESQDARNALRSAEADLSAAQAALTNAQGVEDRQKQLLDKGFTTRSQYDQALQQLQTAQAQTASAEARLRNAQDNLSYTELKSDVAGVITAKGAEPGEVVQAGKMILQVARDGGRDAVFNVPAQMIRNAPKDPMVTVALSDDPRITTNGRVREVAPQADPTTGTYEVKIHLDDPPPAMRLGATVVGSMTIDTGAVIVLPGTALIQTDGKAAVWVVDPAKKTVAQHPVTLLRYDPGNAIISDGLKDGDIVVTAGVHALRPGQEVRLLQTTADNQK